MSPQSMCLGLSFLGNCAYDPSSPALLQFSIGEGISAIALIFVLHQLIDDIDRARIYIRKTLNNFSYFLFAFALLSVFISAALPFIPGPALPLIGYPIFWEYMAGVIFVISILLFLYVIKTPLRITKCNFKKYIEVTYKIIASNNELLLKQFAIEIEPSIKQVINMADEKRNDNEIVKQANTLLMFWSDKCFCKVIVEHAVRTLFVAVTSVKNQENYQSTPGHAFISELISQSVTSNNSLLNKENEYYGLGLFKNMTTEIFGDYEFVNSRYRPLYYALQFRTNKNFSPRHVENYFMCLNTSLKACLETDSYHPKSNPFYFVFDELSHLSLSMAYKLRNIGGDAVLDSFPYLVLSEISQGFHDLLDTIFDYDINSEFNETEYDCLSDPSIYGAIARGLFKFYESISACLAHDDLIRGLAISLWMGIEGKIRGNNQVLQRIVLHLSYKIDENIIKRRYPLVVRLLISLDGLSEPLTKDLDQPKVILFNHLMDLLKVHYKNIFDEDPDFASFLLPQNVMYDSDKSLLRARYVLGDDSILNLN